MAKFMKRLDKKLNLMIIKDDETIYSSMAEGIVPLIEPIDHLGLSILVNSVIIDRVVGKAAALLISYVKAREIYTGLLSRGAIVVLKMYKIQYSSKIVVDEILDKNKTKICPFEEAVLDIEDPKKGYEKLSYIVKLNKGL